MIACSSLGPGWTQVAAAALDALRILQTIHADLFGPGCVVGSGGKSVGYLAHGTATDWMFKVRQVPRTPPPPPHPPPPGTTCCFYVSYSPCSVVHIQSLTFQGNSPDNRGKKMGKICSTWKFYFRVCKNCSKYWSVYKPHYLSHGPPPPLVAGRK